MILPARLSQRTPAQQQQSAPHAALLMIDMFPSNPNFASVVLQSHMDTGSYVDIKGHSSSVVGSPGNVAGSTGFGNCVEFTSTGYVEWTDGGSGDFAMGTGDFMGELMVYPTRVGSNVEVLLDMSPTSSVVGPILYWTTGASGAVRLWYNGTDRLTTLPLTNNAWNHLAFGRQGGTWGVWANGESWGTVGTAYSIGSTKIRVGRETDDAAPFFGRVDEVRFHRGVCPLTPGSLGSVIYPVPTAPHPDS